MNTPVRVDPYTHARTRRYTDEPTEFRSVPNDAVVAVEGIVIPSERSESRNRDRIGREAPLSG
jgi:hypothetical protein